MLFPICKTQIQGLLSYIAMNQITGEVKKQKILVIGAGPVGSLAAIYAAQRGHDVEVYELRDDLRDSSVIPLNFTKSINLALSERGINALINSGRTEMVTKILQGSVPMKARMIHGQGKDGLLYEESQDYDIHGRAIHAIDRSDLNSALIEELSTFPNVRLMFNHKLIRADLKSRKIDFEIVSKSSTEPKKTKTGVDFDLLIGADGAHSAVRHHMMKQLSMDYSQSYIDVLWCEFKIEAKGPPYVSSSDSFKMSPHHLHIWPGKDRMFIAIPSSNGEFTCTLFMPASIYKSIDQSSEALVKFFQESFPGVTPQLISPESLIESFIKNPHLPLISLTCSPHHFSDNTVILGDATHAMVPFYGQGMNAGLEDVRILFQTLDKYSSLTDTDTKSQALEEYSSIRVEDSKAISQLAQDNYEEMRASVKSRMYKIRKRLDETINLWFPNSGWATKYSRVSFGNERYSDVIKITIRQEVIIEKILRVFGVGFLTSIGFGMWKFRGVLKDMISRR